MLTIRTAVVEDAIFMAPRLRQADHDEVLASGCPDPLLALEAGIGPGQLALTGIDEQGEPVTMFGSSTHPRDARVGVVWALATDSLKDHTKSFLGPSRDWVEALNRRHPVLMNFTDCRNEEHHRWLRWCGFTFINTVQGPTGLPFYEFVRLRNNDV